ncbi:pyridoxal phosphate-dependent transferase [Triangularia verruculosa]|uniref:Pyridoxal phosphate-dependent transferase n=1 Tax=Triangularia verruculosa TaxID=2587418 RepID=A0AAN6XF65_9PEZI|nr:pyridoxal phosphate-dependent transferase [Triangularia verruculosa]
MSSGSANAAKRALEAAEARFVANNPLSRKQHELAVGALPGGNTRTLLHTAPFPLTMKQGKGAYVWDEDGHKYLDLVGELTAGLYGHSNPIIRETILSTFDSVGLSLGSTTVQEHKHAALLCSRFKLERVRMANTGTEANMHALAGARHFTSRRKIIVFSGGYHGAVFSFPNGKPAANTVDRDDFVVVPRYNDTELAVSTIKSTVDLAAVLVEPMQGAGGCIPGTREFLHAIQDAAHEVGALFMLDEVMTSRLAPHGLGVELGLKPDLVTMGKYLGGGLAFGAFGGREEVMAVYDPRLEGSLAHSGTFNNNTLVMCIGFEALSRVFTEEACVELNEKGDRLRESLKHVTKGTKIMFTGRGSLIGVHFVDACVETITCGEDIQATERRDLRDLFWFEMLEQGFWTTRRGFVALIMETEESELVGFVAAVEKFVERHREIMAL